MKAAGLWAPQLPQKFGGLGLNIAAIAVLLVIRGDPGVHVHMMIATALGVGISVLLGSALMTLTFLSSSSGHDDEATPKIRKDDDQ